MQSVSTSVDRSFSVRVLDRVASAERGSHPLVGAALVSMPWLVAFEGQDPFAYARAVAAALAELEGAGRGVGGKSDNSYALSNSPLTILFSSSKLPDRPACPSSMAQYVRSASPYRFEIKFPPARFLHSVTTFPSVRPVSCGTA